MITNRFYGHQSCQRSSQPLQFGILGGPTCTQAEYAVAREIENKQWQQAAALMEQYPTEISSNLFPVFMGEALGKKLSSWMANDLEQALLTLKTGLDSVDLRLSSHSAQKKLDTIVYRVLKAVTKDEFNYMYIGLSFNQKTRQHYKPIVQVLAHYLTAADKN